MRATKYYRSYKKAFSYEKIVNSNPDTSMLFVKIHMKITLTTLQPITWKFYFHALHKIKQIKLLKSLAVSIASKFIS